MSGAFLPAVAIMDAVPDGLVLMDSHLQVRHLNPAFRSLWAQVLQDRHPANWHQLQAWLAPALLLRKPLPSSSREREPPWLLQRQDGLLVEESRQWLADVGDGKPGHLLCHHPLRELSPQGNDWQSFSLAFGLLLTEGQPPEPVRLQRALELLAGQTQSQRLFCYQRDPQSPYWQRLALVQGDPDWPPPAARLLADPHSPWQRQLQQGKPFSLEASDWHPISREEQSLQPEPGGQLLLYPITQGEQLLGFLGLHCRQRCQQCSGYCHPQLNLASRFLGDRLQQRRRIAQWQLQAQQQHSRQQHLLQSLAQIGQSAEQDFLTGLLNRRRMMQHLERRHSQPGTQVLLLIDVDHFKQINDRHGHPVGDQVLVTLTRRINQRLRREDLFARWGGEEFLVLAPCEDEANARQLAEALRQAVAALPIQPVGTISVSIGLALAQAGEPLEQWLTRADQALYRAKQGGRNRVC